MKLFSPRIWAIALAAIGLTLTAQPAKAEFVTFGFTNITGNSAESAGIGEAQMTVDVGTVDGNPNQVSFTFRNAGPLQSTIAQVFFDDGTLLGIATINNGPGVDFDEGASPGDLPGGNTLDTPFVATAGFLASADNPAPQNGVNPGEWVEIIFDLKDGQTYQDVLDAIALDADETGSLRIGIHVINFGNGESEGFVNDGGGGGGNAVPAPAGLILLATAVPVFALRRIVRRKRVA